MKRRLAPHRLGPGHAPSNRLAWWAAFLITIGLIAVLNAIRADAATLPVHGPSLSLAANLESEEEEEEEEAEFGEEELEEGAFGEAECGGLEDECLEAEELEEEWPPPECLLSETRASVSAFQSSRRVVLTVGFATRAPVRVAIAYWLRGPHGAMRVGAKRRRLAARGSFRETKRLSSRRMARALGARSWTVTIDPLGTPGYCRGIFDLRLGPRRASAHGPVWSS